jgi:acyl transferase domain-containing protein
MVFTGQGSQWPQMGYDLFQTYPVFLQTIECLDRYLQELGELAPKWKIEEELHKSARLSRVNEAEFSQPLCTGLQIALIDTLAALGILPAGVVGHSSGEIAAAYAAQAITARDAILIAYFRGLVSRKQDKPGAMVAVGMSWEELENYIVPGVVRACDNSPNSVTLSGDAEPLLTLMDTLKKNIPGVVATKLHVDMAYHSHHMREVGDEYYHMLISSQISEGSPLIPFFSSLTGKLLPMNSTDAGDKHFGPHYWQMNLESPVLFNSAVSSIIREFKNPVFVEIGPHAALAGPLRQIMTRKSCSAPHISTLMRRKKGLEEMLKAVGRLWSLQVNVDFTKLMPFGTCVPDLPSYPWNHRRSHWFEPRVSRERRMREHPHHDLLGIRVPETSGIEPVWRNLLHIDNTPWLRDHKVRKDIVFPLAGYIAMAAEGARQLSPIQEGVELRNIIVTTALVLREEDPTELITNFRRHRLTNAQESTWWEFVVSSHNGHAWTKHCFGQIRASSNTIVGQDRIPEDKMMPHKVHIRQWYERARRGGSGYGYHFTTLEELRTSASGEVGLAKANVRNNWHGDEVNYHIHPVLVDTYLQLLCSAAHHGMREGYRQLIPASVGYIAFSTCTADSLTFIASCKRSDNRDGFVGSGVCFNNTATSLSISDVSVFPLAENIDMEVEHGPPITARSEWVPHIEFQNFSGLVMPSEDISEDFQLLETLAEVSMVLSQRLLSETSVESPNPHLNNYKSWLDRTVIHRYNNVDMEDLACRMEIYVGKLANTAVAPMATAIIQIQENITDIISGKKSGLEFLSSGFKLDAIQTFLKDYHAFNFFQYLGHAYPNLRVLEIGAGLGTATTSIVKALTRHDGQALFSRYVYTDSLPGLVVAAKEKFKGQPNMEFATLDINIDPASQEFKDEKFDLIIASNVLHSKLRLGSTLTHLRGLLSSRGRLVLQQPHTGMKWTKYILGIAPDWWSNGEDGIFDEHYVPTDDIRQGIVNAGFADPQEKLSEPTETGHGGTVLCLKPQLVERSCKVSIVSRDASDSDTSVGISQELKKRGLELFHCTLHDNLPPDHDAIILLDSEHSFLEQMNSESFEDLKRFLSTINNSSGVFWITKPAQTECSDPHNGLTVGFARVIRSELALDFATCETDDLSFDGLQILIDVFCKFRQRDNGTTPGPEMEYSINAGEVRVHRFFPFLLQDELRVSEPSDEVVLTTHLPGRLDSLHWTESLMLEPNGQEVEIVVYASGLNFRVCEAFFNCKKLGHSLISKRRTCL